MSSRKRFATSFVIVFISSLVAGLIVLGNDLQVCASPAPNIAPIECAVHWQLILAAGLSALISGIAHALQDEVSSLEADTTVTTTKISTKDSV